LEENYTVGFRFLAVRAGSTRSFEEAREDLKAFCGLEPSHMTIRMLCDKEVAGVATFLASAEMPKDFIAAKGNVEIMIDATKVNTLEGWKDAKICIYSKRLLGEGVEISYWDNRTRKMLPDVLSSVAFGAIEEKALFQQRVNLYRSLLRVGSTSDISGLGDGADWIWNIYRDVFGKIRECLDVYHALENLSKTGKVLYQEGTEEYEQWRETTQWELLGSGFEQIEKRLDGLDQVFKDDEPRMQELARLHGYLENHENRLCYRERLSEGRVIGSGQVEGACKSMIGRRLKQTNARWDVNRLNRMVMLCAVHYSSLWEKYWTQAN
jgi:hypothetical protein